MQNTLRSGHLFVLRPTSTGGWISTPSAEPFVPTTHPLYEGRRNRDECTVRNWVSRSTTVTERSTVVNHLQKHSRSNYQQRHEWTVAGTRSERMVSRNDCSGLRFESSSWMNLTNVFPKIKSGSQTKAARVKIVDSTKSEHMFSRNVWSGFHIESSSCMIIINVFLK